MNFPDRASLYLIVLGGALLASSCQRFSSQPAEKPTSSAPGQWRPLFRGQTNGWEMVGPGELRLEGGELVTYGGMGMLWYPGEKFGNCEIRVVFKMTTDHDNSGVFIRMPSRPLTPFQAVNQGYEVQIENRGDDRHRTGCLYSLSQALAQVSPAPGEWTTMLIRLDGKRTMVTINDRLVTDFTEGQPVPEKKIWYEPDRGPRPEKGYIGLQNHGDDARVHFKEVAVRSLR